MTFDQIAGMQKLIETLARMDIPDEHDLTGETGDDALLRAIEDADAFYDFIEQARDILRRHAVY